MECLLVTEILSRPEYSESSDIHQQGFLAFEFGLQALAPGSYLSTWKL